MGWRVLASVAFYLAFKWEPVAAFGAVERVWASVHFEGLANGADSNLDGASPDSLSMTASTIADMFGKCGEQFNALDGRCVCELGVHVTEGHNEV